MPKRPGIEQIHDLRTSSRRFETEVDAFGLSSKPNERRLLPDLRRIRKRAGKIRDLDVLTGHLLGLVVNREQDCIIESDTPRVAGGLVSGAASKAVVPLV